MSPGILWFLVRSPAPGGKSFVLPIHVPACVLSDLGLDWARLTEAGGHNQELALGQS